MTDPPFDRTEQDEAIDEIENYTEPVSLFAPLIDITEIGTHVLLQMIVEIMHELDRRAAEVGDG